MTLPDPEEKFFSLSDLVWLFRKKKKIIFCAASIFSFIAVIYVFINSPVYKAEATFKEGMERVESQGMLRDVVSQMGWASDAPQAAAILNSREVLRPLIGRLGLQVDISEQRAIRRWARAFEGVICAEFGCRLSDSGNFRFSNAVFEGEKPLEFLIRFIDRERFEIRRKRFMLWGKVGEKIDGKKFSFFIERLPKNLRTGTDYCLTIRPWVDVAKEIRKNLQIVSHKANKSIYDLSYLDSDRFGAKDILNGIIEEYQRYLKRDHDQIAEQQVAYLEERQNMLFDRLGRDFDEHVRYLQKNVGERGFVRASQESAALLKPYRELFSKSFAADLEMEQLCAFFVNPHVLIEGKSSIGEVIQRLRKDVQQLEEQRDLLAASLYFHSSSREETSFDAAQSNKEELQKIRQDLEAAKGALNEAENSNVLPLSLDLFHDPDKVVQNWARHLDQASSERNDFIVYLRNLVRLFSVREKILLERQFNPQNDSELNGIDLATARQMIVQTSQNLDGAKAAIHHYRHLLDQIDDPAFELSSLSTVLRDPVSQHIMSAAADLHLQLEDEGHHSEKEVGRIKSETSLQRKILKEHLQQMIVVEELNRSIFQDKIISLQQISLDCIHRQIGVANEQISSLIQQRKESLLCEKQILSNKMQQLRSQMNELPVKWRAESLLKLKTELGIKVMQSVAQLVESKNIGRHLHHVESKPLDLAILPFVPENPHLFLLMLAGAIVGFFVSFAGVFLNTLHRGFPLSLSTLQALRYPCAGFISFPSADFQKLPDADLESFRKILLCLDATPQSKLIGLFIGNGPDYSRSLAQLIAQSGRKVLLVPSDISETAAPIIRSSNGYDEICSEAPSCFSVERIRSAAFQELLFQKLAPSYDHILLSNSSPLDRAECAALLAISHFAIVTIVEEPIELLTPFIRWAYDEGRSRLTFLIARCSL